MKDGGKLFHQTRAPRTNIFRRPFAETFDEPFPKAFGDPVDELQEQGEYRDIFSPELYKDTIWHVFTRLNSIQYALTEDQLVIINDLIDEIESQIEIAGGDRSEINATQDDASLTITKAIDPLSPDFHFSYNRVSLVIDGLKIEWYFLLADDAPTVEGDKLSSVQKDPNVPEIMFEKSEANKGEFNSTGYKFWWSDGHELKNNEVTPFIRNKRKSGDPRFLTDFPVVQEESMAPTYTIPGSKYTYYTYFSALTPDPTADEDNLHSFLLMGNKSLEYVYDGDLVVDTNSPSGEYILLLRKGLNQIYKDNPNYIPLVEENSFDSLTLKAFKQFQIDYSIPGGRNGVVGKETIRKMDELLLKAQVAEPTFTFNWLGPEEMPILTLPTQTDQTNLTTYAGLVITSEQLEPDQEKVDKAIAESDKYENQSSWDKTFNTEFLASVDAMSEMDMSVLPLDKREQMIRQIGGFTYINGPAENAVAKLINSTPAGEQAKKLQTWLSLSGLLPVFESSISGENYTAYQSALRLLYFNAMSIEQTAEKIGEFTEKTNAVNTNKSYEELAQQDHIFYWLSPGFISQFEYHFHRFNFMDMEINDEGRLTFTYWHTAMFFTGPETPIDLDPFEMVMVKFITSGESVNAAAGETVYMPAINLLALYNQQWNQEAFATIDVALMFAGGIGLLSKASKMQKLIAALDLALGAAAIVINDYRAKIAETEGGRKFLEAWDTVNGVIAIYGLARTVMAMPQLFRNLKNGYKNFTADPSPNLTSTDLEKINNETSLILKDADEIRLEQIKNTSKEQRLKDLSFDPSNNKTDPYEGFVGSQVEADYGYFERDPSGAGDFISISGPYEGKVFDAIGLPEKAVPYNKDMTTFLDSLNEHLYKSVDYLLLDMTYMTLEQKQSVLAFLTDNQLLDSERIIRIGE